MTPTTELTIERFKRMKADGDTAGIDAEMERRLGPHTEDMTELNERALLVTRCHTEKLWPKLYREQS